MLPARLKFGLKKQDLSGLLWTLLAVCFVIAMVIQPKTVYDGAVNGLKTWWNIVFPSLLPFFIFSEILMRLGLVRFIGSLLEPVMRPVFNVPGAGAFVMVIGFTSGFPIGSMVTAQLRQQGLCSRIEAERLMSFTNNSSPLFMLTAVSVGMFGRPELGAVIAGSHYLANLMLGLLLRFYGNDNRKPFQNPAANWSLTNALRSLLQHQRLEKQSLGRLLGESVSSSITKLLNIGGFIILFAVIINLLSSAGIIHRLAGMLGVVLLPLGFSPEILTALASGLLEMTIGTKMASEAPATELQRLMAVAMILGWSGLSIHAQVASMIAKTDIRMKLFVITRFAQAALATALTCLLYTPEKLNNTSLLVQVISPAVNHYSQSAPTVLGSSFVFMVGSLILLTLLSLTCYILSQLPKWVKNNALKG